MANNPSAAPPEFGPLPPRFSELKREIIASYPDFEARVTKAWGEILAELDKATKEIAAQGSSVSSMFILRKAACSCNALTLMFRGHCRTYLRSTSASWGV